jgi:hypothetical protein
MRSFGVFAFALLLLTAAGSAFEAEARQSAERAALTLKRLSAKAASGKAASKGPSANSGQVIELVGNGFDPSVTVEFFGFAGSAFVVNPTNVTAKRITVSVPEAAVTGPVRVLNGSGGATSSLNLQVVPVVTALPDSTREGAQLLIDGKGFSYHTQVFLPGVAGPITPAIASPIKLDLIVPSGIRSGKLTVVTSGGRSKAVRLNVVTAKQLAAAAKRSAEKQHASKPPSKD